MNLRTRIGNWLIRAKPSSWTIAPWQTGRPYAPKKNYEALVKRYASYVYAAATMNAINCAQVPLRLYVARNTRGTKCLWPTRSIPSRRIAAFREKEAGLQQWMSKAVDVEEVLDHPMLDLLNQPNEFTNKSELIEKSFLYQELVGNAYWKLVFNNAGMPESIWQLQAHRVKIIPDTEKFISGYEIRIPSGQKVRFDLSEVVQYKYPNPLDDYYGMGPLEAAVVAADLGEAMNEYEVALFRNGGQPDVAMILPPDSGKPDPDEIKRIEGRWRQKYNGVAKAGGMMVLYGGADVKPLSLSPKEMAFLAGRKASLNEVAAIFGIPMSKLTPDNVNKANAETGEVQYARDTIQPKLRRFEQKINQRISPLYDPQLFVAFDNAVADDQNFRLKERDSNIRNGYTSINEERAIDGIEPALWGDEPGPITTQRQEEPENIPEKIIKKGTLLPLVPPSDVVDKSFVDSMITYLGQLREKILEGFDHDGAELVEKGVKTTIDEFLEQWFNLVEENAILATRLLTFTTAALQTAGNAAVISVVDNIDFDAAEPRAAGALRARTNRASVHINKTQSKELRRTLAAGIEAGEGASELRKRIQDKFGEDLTRHQALRIARSETIWAWNEGAVQGYIQSGVVTRKIWVTANDDRTCQWCPLMDGQTVDVEVNYHDFGGTFEGQEGGIMQFDFESIGHPPLHPMCRCTVAAVTEEF